MLILKAPIELKNRTDFIKADEGFYNRLSANYSLIGSDIGEADLLHAVTSPPEIFIGGGDITTVSGNTFISNKNEEKLSIINNLLNRIVVNADMPLTYQDRVYISDVLYKIGIKNDSVFMNEVLKIREENRRTNEFINVFLSGGEEARDSAVRQYISNFIRSLNREDEGGGERISETTLSREIMERLHTGAIYQILANFSSSLNSSVLSRNEFLMSEQEGTARELLQERFIERVTGERGELVFRNENIYEEEFFREERTEGGINNEITAAVLLDLVRNLFVTGYEKVNTDNRQWMEYRDILYSSSDNTLRRLNYITEETAVSNIYASVLPESEISFPEIPGEEEEPLEAAGGEEERLIRELTAINERNIRNVEKYKKLLGVIERMSTPVRRKGGQGRTLDAAREALRGEIGPGEIRTEREEERETRETLVLREIERLFPEEHEHIIELLSGFNTTNDFDNTLVVNNNISSLLNDIESVRLENLERETVSEEREEIIREERNEVRNIIERAGLLNEGALGEEGEEEGEEGLIHRTSPEELQRIIKNIEETDETREKIRETGREVTEEIRRLKRTETSARDEAGRDEGYPEVPIVHKTNETLTMEEVQETLEEFRKSNERRTETKSSVTETVDNSRNTILNNEETVTSLNEREIEDVTALIDSGVRARMESISNEVMQRLEKRLRNEKARRGI